MKLCDRILHLNLQESGKRKVGDTMTFRETREAADGTSVASAGLTSTDEREAPGSVEAEEEAPRAPTEDTHTYTLTKGEDPVRLYLKEIGRVSLLTAAQEVEIGRRIEGGQIALRRTLAGIPMAVEALLAVGDHLRRGETPADEVMVLAEGGELEAKAIRPVLLAFQRIRRLARKIAKLEASLTAKRRSAVYRRDTTAAIGTARQAIQKTVADMPLKPALIDDIVAQVRRAWGQIRKLQR